MLPRYGVTLMTCRVPLRPDILFYHEKQCIRYAPGCSFPSLFTRTSTAQGSTFPPMSTRLIPTEFEPHSLPVNFIRGIPASSGISATAQARKLQAWIVRSTVCLFGPDEKKCKDEPKVLTAHNQTLLLQTTKIPFAGTGEIEDTGGRNRRFPSLAELGSSAEDIEGL